MVSIRDLIKGLRKYTVLRPKFRGFWAGNFCRFFGQARPVEMYAQGKRYSFKLKLTSGCSFLSLPLARINHESFYCTVERKRQRSE